MSRNDKQSVLEQLAQDARRRIVAINLPDGELTWEHICEVRDRFKKLQAENRKQLSNTKVSRMLGKGYGNANISMFMNAATPSEMKCDGQKMARAINSVMERFMVEKSAPAVNGFVETEVAKNMLSGIRQVIASRGIGLIYADAGRGKTMTLKAAAEIWMGSLYIRVRRGSTSPSGLGILMARATGVGRSNKLVDTQDRVIETLKGSNRLLLLDEAHQLKSETLEYIRDIHDEANVPVILAGTIDLNKMCTDTDVFYGQFNRRVTFRYDVTEAARNSKRPRPLHSISEIKQIWESDGLRFTGDGAESLTRMANVLGGGGLGLCHQVVQIAAALMPASKSGVKQLDAKTIMKVLRTMHGVEHTHHQIENQMNELKFKVA